MVRLMVPPGKSGIGVGGGFIAGLAFDLHVLEYLLNYPVRLFSGNARIP